MCVCVFVCVSACVCVYSIFVTNVVNATGHRCSCVLLGYHVLISLFFMEKYTSLSVRFLFRNSLNITHDYWLFQILIFPRRLNLGHYIIVA